MKKINIKNFYFFNYNLNTYYNLAVYKKKTELLYQ